MAVRGGDSRAPRPGAVDHSAAVTGTRNWRTEAIAVALSRRRTDGGFHLAVGAVVERALRGAQPPDDLPPEGQVRRSAGRPGCGQRPAARVHEASPGDVDRERHLRPSWLHAELAEQVGRVAEVPPGCARGSRSRAATPSCTTVQRVAAERPAPARTARRRAARRERVGGTEARDARAHHGDPHRLSPLSGHPRVIRSASETGSPVRASTPSALASSSRAPAPPRATRRPFTSVRIRSSDHRMRLRETAESTIRSGALGARTLDRLERRVAAEIDDPPAAGPERQPECDQADVVLLAGQAGEQRRPDQHRGPSHALTPAAGRGRRLRRSAPARPRLGRVPTARRAGGGRAGRLDEAACRAWSAPAAGRRSFGRVIRRSDRARPRARRVGRQRRSAGGGSCSSSASRRQRSGLGSREARGEMLAHQRARARDPRASRGAGRRAMRAGFSRP